MALGLRVKLHSLMRRPEGADTSLAIGLLIAGLLPLGVRGLELGDLPNIAPPPLALVLTAGLSLPLCVRRSHPVWAALVVTAAWVATQLTGAPVGVAGLGLLIAIYSVAVHQRKNRRAVGATAAAAYVGVAIALSAAGSRETALDYVTFFVVLLVPWLIGRLVRSSLLLQEESRRYSAEAAVQGVLRDLAVDLHDVVTHHVTAMVVQAESAAYLEETDREGRDQILRDVATAGRRALGELRELLGAIDPNTGDTATTQRPAADVVRLVEQLRREGHPISIDVTGEPVALTDAINATLYRCAQESITNALKHGNGGPISVHVIRSPSMIELTVRNPFDAPSDPGAGLGRGLRNMRHRVELVGGDLTIHATRTGFEVAVLLPLRQR
jgi:signal transduction histidine kinase